MLKCLPWERFRWRSGWDNDEKWSICAGLDDAVKVTIENRPFYLYGGHIELIRFNEYYGIPRGHEHDPLYSLSIKNMVSYYIFLGEKAIYRNIPKVSPGA